MLVFADKTTNEMTTNEMTTSETSKMSEKTYQTSGPKNCETKRETKRPSTSEAKHEASGCACEP